MIVQKVFSDLEEEEMLYSVLMDEEEIMMFSEIQKEFTAANKAAKRAWLEKQGAGGFLGIGKKTGDETIRRGRSKLNNKVIKSGSHSLSKNGANYQLLDPKTMTLNQRINAKGRLEEYGLRDSRNLPISPSSFRRTGYSGYKVKNGKPSKYFWEHPDTEIKNIQKRVK